MSAPEGPLIAYFDRDRLEQVVQNLLLNALKFTRGREGRRVEIGWSPDPERGVAYWAVVERLTDLMPLLTGPWPDAAAVATS